MTNAFARPSSSLVLRIRPQHLAHQSFLTGLTLLESIDRLDLGQHDILPTEKPTCISSFISREWFSRESGDLPCTTKNRLTPLYNVGFLGFGDASDRGGSEAATSVDNGTAYSRVS